MQVGLKIKVPQIWNWRIYSTLYQVKKELKKQFIVITSYNFAGHQNNLQNVTIMSYRWSSLEIWYGKSHFLWGIFWLWAFMPLAMLFKHENVFQTPLDYFMLCSQTVNYVRLHSRFVPFHVLHDKFTTSFLQLNFLSKYTDVRGLTKLIEKNNDKVMT